MKKVVGVRFKAAGKIYDFDCGQYDLNIGDYVVVETGQGLGLGMIVVSPFPYVERKSDRTLKKVIRIAHEKDLNQRKENYKIEQTAYKYCQTCIVKLELKMNLFSVENSFDGDKLTFFFTSEGRVDFRQLVKMLAKQLVMKIEMRQVGIRNQAKMCGGMGRCGQQICCSSFLEKFEHVSIRMAKEQNLSLNPTKISGQCGRLMCCLNYENEVYKDLKKKYPKIGKTVKTKDGKGKVIRHNVICGRLSVRLDNRSDVEVKIDDIIQEK